MANSIWIVHLAFMMQGSSEQERLNVELRMCDNVFTASMSGPSDRPGPLTADQLEYC